MFNGSNMPFIKRSIYFGLSCASYIAIAAGGGGAAPTEGAPEKKKSEKSPADEYVAKTTKLNTLQSRIDGYEKDFEDLVLQKASEKNQTRIQEIIKQMVEISKARNKDVADFNQVRQEMIYKYPAMTQELNRNYSLEQKKDVNELESANNLDEMLNRTKKAIDRKFGAPEEKSGDTKRVHVPVEEKKKLRLEK